MREQPRRAGDGGKLRWQSWLVLAAAAPWCAIVTLRYAMATWTGATQTALLISLALAFLVWLARAATPLAAVTGGLFTAVLTLAPQPGGPYHSGLPSLLALFLLTWGATRFGRSKKQQLGRGRGQAWAQRRPGGSQSRGRRIGCRRCAYFSPLSVCGDRGRCVGGGDGRYLGERTGRSAGRSTLHAHQSAPRLRGHRRSDQPGGHAGRNQRSSPAGAGSGAHAQTQRLPRPFARHWARSPASLSIPCSGPPPSGAAGSTTMQ